MCQDDGYNEFWRAANERKREAVANSDSSSGSNAKELEQALTEFGNAQFDCGEHDGDADEYEKLLAISKAKRKAIIDKWG